MTKSNRDLAVALHTAFREVQHPDDQRFWVELSPAEQYGWMAVTEAIYKKFASVICPDCHEPFDRWGGCYCDFGGEVDGFKQGERVRAVHDIGTLLNDSFNPIDVIVGDMGVVLTVREDEEDQPITVKWDKSPINDVDSEEIEHV